MHFLKIKFLIFYLFGIVFLDFIPLTSKPSKAENFSENNSLYSIKRQNKNHVKKHYSLSNKKLINYLRKDIDNQNNNFIKLIVSNNNLKGSTLNITSDIQYEVDNIFHAEGNVIMNLGNSILIADKVIYNRSNKEFKAIGNIKFSKGSQYFEASNLIYNTKSERGYIDNVYGLIDIKTINKDLNISVEKDMKIETNIKNAYDISDLNYLHSTTFGLVNEIEEDKTFNVTDLTVDIPEITRWRFKTEKFLIENKILKSDRVIFTNDPYNKPQFFLESNNFSTEIIEDKLKIVSRNSWINLDDKIKFPIGRRSIFDKDPVSTWSLGSDFDERDGWYISRSFIFGDIFNDYQLDIRPYLLFQRAIKGNTNAFREEGSSILSKKVKNDISPSDVFALDVDLTGKLIDWDFGLSTRFNSLNTQRLSESSRAKFILKNSFILDQSEIVKDKLSDKENKLTDKKNSYQNIFDIKLTSSFREEISKGYSGDSEIYFGNSISLANRKSWVNEDIKSNFALIYDFGRFTAESSNVSELKTLSRNVFASTFDYEFPIIKIKPKDINIDRSYKYSPVVVKEGLKWITNIQTGLFLYSDDSNQSAFSISSGPEITFGDFKRDFIDYSRLRIIGNYILKDGESPFNFDSIDDTLRLQFSFDQHLIGALVFSMDTYLNLDVDEENYGKFEKYNFALNFQRRAYKVGAYYEPSSESVGIQFQIFNFDYSGFSRGF